MRLNLKNFNFNGKFLDIFCYVFCGIYLFFVICFAISDAQFNASVQREIDNMLLQANAVNKRIEDSNFFNSTEEEDVISSEPLFNDGKTALIRAYNNTINANSFYGEAFGTMVTTSIGITVKVSTYTQVIKYSPTKFYDMRANRLIETNAPSALMGMINDLSNKGVKNYKVNGTNKHIESNYTYFENNVPKANFNGCSVTNEQKSPLIAENLYIINEETVKEITYFKIKYKKGIPSEYYVQAKLDTKKSVEKYKDILKVGANLSKDPVFNDVTITVIINSKGLVSSVTAIDKCTIEKMGQNPCTMTQTYIISGVGEEMTYFDEDFN